MFEKTAFSDHNETKSQVINRRYIAMIDYSEYPTVVFRFG